MKEDIVRFDYIQRNVMQTEYFIYPVYKNSNNNNNNNNNNENNKASLPSKPKNSRHRNTRNNDNPKLKNRASRNPNRLNLLYIMVDSISRASAVRYLNATYKTLDRDPNTVIMKVCLKSDGGELTFYIRKYHTLMME